LSSSFIYRDSEFSLSEDDKNLDSQIENNEKYLLERKISTLALIKNSSVSQLRISDVYGPSMKSGFIKDIRDSILNGTDLKVFSDNQILRDFIYEEDVLFALQELMKLETMPPIINISTGIGTTIESIPKLVRSEGFPLKLQKIFAAYDIKRSSLLDCSLLSSLIDWSPDRIENQVKNILIA
jgi:nucleoside-diphosphate-sugar epimerase